MLHQKYIGALGAVALSVTLAACGSTAEPEAAKPAASNSSTATALASSSPTPRATLLTKVQLTSALLPLSQMPAGWSAEGDDTPGDKTFCDYRQPHKVQVQVTRTFQKGGGLTATVAAVGIRQYASTSDAAESFTAMEKHSRPATRRPIRVRAEVLADERRQARRAVSGPAHRQ